MNTTFLNQKKAYKLYIEQAAKDRKNLWKSLVLIGIIYIAVYGFVTIALAVTVVNPLVSEVIGQLLNFAMGIYVSKYLLDLISEPNTSLEGVFGSLTGKQVLYALGAYILSVILISLGFVLLIIPGIIISYMFMFVSLVSVENITKPLAALKESHRLTNGYKLKMFVAALSTTIHYLGLPFVLAIAGLALLPVSPLAMILIVLAGLWSIYGSLAIATLLPRMYRDLQQIKSKEESSSDGVIEIEEVLEGNQE